MELREFEVIHKKVESLKEKSMKAQGSLDSLKEECIQKYTTDDIDRLKEIKQSQEEQIEQNNEKIDSLFADLKGLTNWNLV